MTLRETSFYLSFIQQSRCYYASFHPKPRPGGGYYLIMQKFKTNAILFDTFDEDHLSQTFRLRVVDHQKRFQSLHLGIEPFSPNNLYLSSTHQPSIRFRLINKKFECLIQHESPQIGTTENITNSSVNDQFDVLGELYAGKQTKEGIMVVVNTAQHFLYKSNLSGIYGIGTYAVPFKPIHFISMINEIPNVDIIPGTVYFKACLHQNFEHSTLFKMEQGEIGVKFHVIWNNSPTMKTVSGDWWVKALGNGEGGNDIVFCEEQEANEFCISGGRLEVIENGKIRTYIGLGEKRDDESFFLTTYPLDLLTFKLEVKIIRYFDNQEKTTLEV
ncbi:hypothetical protein EHI8A_010660 [Entamoeba histolytica HM-1:IMSS-B]|uniref:Uncharacterized protein n=6 Tax=Entamoeba histolytica TaxID=5759 RepID=C4M3I4_ENTH1|nr:hypothetical protein EHI_138420 [Entamoeba histolytica HM-1:IMSS]EMD49187.1 Hypothetical protein EHI5A_028780 [Entamoeba histolytica KU27]EMH78174.1 hypothetical protein EHI8A_010660 [Entamoeba histolytica HM-1:IMSS-B]EMS16457.1 hypothetical protein KM1_022700 [Entamoeba histolytica HM-3:IMSS]ENY60207.1 hypothetical protein EHI7A_013760 [Entamoeba histolytica HM-1:IMSS-A]GAT95882.1 hypothetical protein CL6EHI_138420 [Entamoeba histolytica]|eukprot:XP_655124.1 hypothetical protein EHI_138420 [Entamoeba histolytica HM-1:IMSS]